MTSGQATRRARGLTGSRLGALAGAALAVVVSGAALAAQQAAPAQPTSARVVYRVMSG